MTLKARGRLPVFARLRINTKKHTRQGRPRTAREVVRRAHARKLAAGEPARSMAPRTRRARVLPEAATARSLRRRRFAHIRVHIHPLLFRYQTLVSEITFILFLELKSHQKFHTKASSRRPKAERHPNHGDSR